MKQVLMGRGFTKGRTQPTTLVVIHTAECGEGDGSAEAVASWGAGPQGPTQAGWHYVVDNDSVVQSVLEENTAWHAGPVNGCSIGVEHAGRAAQTPEQWADPYSAAMLDRSAALVADICRRHKIPVVKLSAGELMAGKRSGICGHVDVTLGLTNGSGHTDPGVHFPWQEYIALVAAKLDMLEAGDTEPPPAVAASAAPDGYFEVALSGQIWIVEKVPKPFETIAEAVEHARLAGCDLPSPALADAIWRACPLKVNPGEVVQATDGVHMNTPELHRAVEDGIERSIGVPFAQVRDGLGGAFKEVVVSTGKVGLYGYHHTSAALMNEATKRRLGVAYPSHACHTPGEGFIVQQFYSKHALTHGDYSQGARRCMLKA